MRFRDVLTFNKDTCKASFSFSNLCKIRNFYTEDVSHIGKVIKYCVLGTNNVVNYKVPLTDIHVLIDKKTGKSRAVQYNPDLDFTIGMFVVVPSTIIIAGILYRIPFKMYLVLGLIGLYVYNKK
jgi:hypothetical protein